MAVKRILIVDDDKHIGTLLRTKLGQMGFDAAVCPSRTAAMQSVREFRPNLVILDVMLGDGLGYQVAREIRRNPEFFHIPILFQSIAGDQHDVEHALAEGGDGYLIKPYTPVQLTEHIQRMALLLQSIQERCPVTGFHGLTAMRRELDHLIFRQEPFSVAYLFMRGLVSPSQSGTAGNEAQVAKITGEAIRHTIENFGFYETFTSHLGGGYFAVKLTLNDLERFKKNVQESFGNRQADLIALGINAHPEGQAPAAQENTFLDLVVGGTTSEAGHFSNATDVFKALRTTEEVARANLQQQGERKELKAGHEHWVGV